jgi:hypothetical protein
MKKGLLFIAMAGYSVFGFSQNSGLTEAELNLLTKIGFSKEIGSDIRNATNSAIKQLPSIDKETGELLEKGYEGIYSDIPEGMSMEAFKTLKAKFRAQGYLVFVFEGENNISGLATIKGTDELEILRYRRTDGINYDLENEDIVKKVSEWKAKYGLIVIGCSRDWLHVEFDNLPDDLNAFAKEVYAFCPDAVDQGVGSLEALSQAIKEMKGVWLWWD